jgi:endonuclease/exonuclease/phosphatase family metal-dependent hydrolase
MKNRFIMLLAVVALSLYTAVTPAQAGNKKNAGQPTLTVMSFNIRYGDANDGTNSWKYRYPATGMMISDQNPDIFGVQEALLYQIKYILEVCPQYKAIGVGREDGKHKGEHMDIFYNKKKIALKKWGSFWLSETPDVPSKGWDAACKRTATWALLKDKRTGEKFYYVNTHLDHIGVVARQKGLAMICDRIKSINPEGYPMILTGDFNISPDNPALTELNQRMKSARNVAFKTDSVLSFNGWGDKESQEMIDYIYFSGFSKCDLFETVTKPYFDYKYVSDHYPVKAVLEF